MTEGSFNYKLHLKCLSDPPPQKKNPYGLKLKNALNIIFLKIDKLFDRELILFDTYTTADVVSMRHLT